LSDLSLFKSLLLKVHQSINYNPTVFFWRGEGGVSNLKSTRKSFGILGNIGSCCL